MGCGFQNWVHVCCTFHHFIGSLFNRWARFVYRHPKPVIAVSLFLSFALIGGFYKFNIYGQSERIFYPQDSKIFHNLNRAQRNFDYYKQYEEFILMSDGTNLDNGDENKNNGDIFSLNASVFRIALDIHNGIMKIPDFHDFCVLNEEGTCSVLSALELFNYNSSALFNIQSNLVSAYLNQSYFMDNGLSPHMNYPQIFGNFLINNSLHTLSTNVLRTVYPVKFAHTRAQYEKNKLWEEKMNRYLQSWKAVVASKGLKLVFNTVSGMDNSVERNTTDNLLLITVSIGAMVLFCALAMHKIGSQVKGHFMLSLLGIGAVTLGIGAAFGLTLYTGLPYVGFVGVLPFLILGVGIDDMFIIVNKVDLLHRKYKGGELIGVAMQQVGFSITMTTVTDLVAFIIGTVSQFPAVQIFCIYAFLSLVFSYGLIITLFLALLSYDIRRMESFKMDCFPCCHGSKEKMKDEDNKDVLLDENEKLGYLARILQCYAQLLMKPVGKCLVLLFSILMLAMGIYGTLHTDLNFDYKILGAEESDYVIWMNTMEKYFPIGRFPIDVVLDDPATDYTSSKIQKQFYQLNDVISQDNYFENDTINWMTTYIDWRGSLNKSNNFYHDLNEFLTIYQYFRKDLVYDLNNKIIASRIHVYTKNNNNWLYRRDAMLSLNKDLKDIKPFYAVSFQLIYLSQLVTIIWSTTMNILICCFVILLVTLPFVINPVVSLLFLVTFICFILELLGVMYFWDLSLNSITMIVMVMAIGFTVDYSCHITHEYLMVDGSSPEERVEMSIMTMGSSVLKGGLSTLMGIIVLSMSSSKLFVLFFKMMFTIILLGLLHGMLILPVLLTVFCRNKLSNPEEEIKDKGKETQVLKTFISDNESELDVLDIRISNV